MNDLLIAPGAPYLIGALAGCLLAGLGLALLQPRQLQIGQQFAQLGPSSRLVIGQAGGLILAGLLLSGAIAGGARGGMRLLLLSLALGSYLGLGLVFPRQPELHRRRAAAQLRRLTPGLIAFVRVGLGSFEAPSAVLSRYLTQRQPQLVPMRELLGESLQISQERRLRPFAALALAARPRGCRELSDVAEALAQSESEGASVETVLAAQQATLELILQSEFKRELRRRTIYLLLMVAISLVVGILLNLLWIMTRGGAALVQLG
ncbi:MAG: hypothetical protein HGA65_17545 [Oscillochloris sp.]|nr:hypothetical protein [Oscillochloris sp.]